MQGMGEGCQIETITHGTCWHDSPRSRTLDPPYVGDSGIVERLDTLVGQSLSNTFNGVCPGKFAQDHSHYAALESADANTIYSIMGGCRQYSLPTYMVFLPKYATGQVLVKIGNNWFITLIPVTGIMARFQSSVTFC
jgi:hypothetical protein